MANPLIKGYSGAEGDSLSYVSISENQKSVYTFTANESVTWSLTGGELDLFTINETTGKLSFKEPVDFEKSFSSNGTILEFQTNYKTDLVPNKFYLQLYDQETTNINEVSITATNFLSYVNDGSYQNTIIHRLVPNFVIQSGGFTKPSSPSSVIEGQPNIIASKGTIINEPLNSNVMGTIAMAKVPDEADSATSQWFINILNNTHLDTQNGGFSAFGHLLGDGIENPILLNDQKIYSVTYQDFSLNELPLVNLSGDNIIRTDNYFSIHDISVVDDRPSQISNTYNALITATDNDGNQSSQYVIINIDDIIGETIIGLDGDDDTAGGIGQDTFLGQSGNDIFDGGVGLDTAIYRGDFADYTFSIANKKLTVTDNRITDNSDGNDTLSNVERLTFGDKKALVTSKEVMAINSIGFQSEKVYAGKSDTYKFYDLGNDKYGIGTSTGIDELTGASVMKFDDKSLNLVDDIKATFDQVTGINTSSGEMFRLYNAAFSRFPDSSGLSYWINQYSSGIDDSRAVASSFIVSSEFKERYGEDVSNAKYVETLYINVLGREYDQAGYNYWLGNLNNGLETRYELLLGFSESIENKGLFSEMTGLY